MKKVLTFVFLLGLLIPMVLFQSSSDATLIFDTELSYHPEAGKRYHYWMFSALIGFETRWANRNFIGGAINCLYDDVIQGSGSGVVDGQIDFSVYESYDVSDQLEGENPGGGPGGLSPGFGTGEMPFDLKDGHIVMKDGGGVSATPPQPLQGSTDPGAPGGGGGGDTNTNVESFYFTPIFDNNIGYTISSSGRLLSVSGLDTIGDITDPTFLNAEDIFDPARSITVKQVFQVAHFLILPDYELHVGETWKAPFWWDLPLVGEPVKIPLTYKLDDIKTYYRFKCAVISFTGMTEVNMDLVNENYTRRKESHVEGDVIINGNIFFDIDRGVVVAIKTPYEFGGSYQNQFLNLSPGKMQSLNWGFLGMLSFDRVDLVTPLGNVVDTRTDKDHVLQDFVWRTDLVLE